MASSIVVQPSIAEKKPFERTADDVEEEDKPKHHSPYPFITVPVGDRVELNRLDDLQLMCRILLGKNVFAPLSAPKKILDIAASSGAWCVEVANEYPDATVTGIDWNPIHRDDAPKNCHFLLRDLNDGLPYEDGSIDFVHVRLLRSAFAKHKLAELVKEFYRVLKPGTGWIQWGEIHARADCEDGTCPPDLNFYKWHEMVSKKLSTHHIHVDGDFVEPLIKEAGFIDVVAQSMKMKGGIWGNPPELHEGGYALNRFAIGTIEASTRVYLGPKHFASKEAMEKFIKECVAERVNPEYHWISNGCLVIGRKPLTE